MFILIDGVCIGLVIFGYKSISNIFLNSIECVEVVKGLCVVVYGFDVLVGVINIIMCKV